MDLSNLRTCMYLRKSREERDSPADEPVEITLRRHETTLLAFAKENKIPIISIKKEVVSGDTLSKRPKMLELLEEIEEGLYDAILVIDFDRIGRGDLLDQGIILGTCKKNNITIITLDRVYNLNDEIDEEMADFNAFFARKELKMINKRLSRGRLRSVKEGNYIGGCPPYGYDYNKATKLLEINEQEAKIVNLIFDLYVNEDMGDVKIAALMRKNKITTKHGKIWDQTTVKKIITNPIYIGITRWKNNENKGKHESIIDEEMFIKAKELRKNRYIPRIRDSYKGRNPLSGLIKCTCGRTMSLRTSKGEPDSLRCPINCGNKGTYVYAVEQKLIKTIEMQLKEIYSELQYKKINKPKKDKNLTLLSNNKNELKRTHEQKNKLFDLLEQGVYDNAIFLERMGVLNNKLSLLEEAIANIETEQMKEKDLKLKIDEVPKIKRLIDFIQFSYWDSTVEDKNIFLHSIVKYVNLIKTEKGIDLLKLEVFLKL